MKTGICGQTRKVSQKGKIPFGASFPLCISAKTNRHNGWFNGVRAAFSLAVRRLMPARKLRRTAEPRPA
jgi:hypothetical protein